MRSGLWRRIGLIGLGWCLLGALGLVYGFGEQPAGSAPLPQAPEGVRVLAVANFETKEQEPVRIAAHPTNGRLYVLGGGGDITLLDLREQAPPGSTRKRRVLSGSEYIEEPKRDHVNIPLPIDSMWVNSPITL